MAISAEQHQRGQDQGPHDEGVEQDGHGQAEADLLHLDEVQPDEAGEDRHHDEGGAGDHACRALDAVEHGPAGGHAARRGLPDPAEAVPHHVSADPALDSLARLR
jgi:hypothetical protein